MGMEKTANIKTHKSNAEIYGDECDSDLLESIKIKGILTPLLITKDRRLISGHRRLSAAKKLKLETVPVHMSNLTDKLDIEEAVILANRQRVKTNEQTIRETAKLHAIEKVRAKQRMSKGGKGTLNAADVKGESIEIAAKKIGIGKDSARQGIAVIDHIDELKDSGKEEQAEQLTEKLNKSVSGAYKEVPKQEKKETYTQKKTKGYTVEKCGSGLFQVTSNNPKYKPMFNATNDNIEWAKWSWNPVTGCNHKCKYCYARQKACNDYYAEAFPTKFNPTFHPGRLAAPKNTKIPATRTGEPGLNNVFVCSMADLFGEWVPAEWIEAVLKACEDSPHWNFLFLTKNPKRYLGFEFPENAWLGATADNQKQADKAMAAFNELNSEGVGNVMFLSCEPLLENLALGEWEDDPSAPLPYIGDWIIIGALKGSENTERQPKWKWVDGLLEQARTVDAKVYFKPNLTVRPKEYPR